MLSEEAKVVKKELEELNQVKRLIKNLQRELAEWKDLSNALKGASMGIVVQGGIKTPYEERRLEKIEELTTRINEKIDEYIDRENRFLRDIEKLDATSQNLIMERYITGKPIRKILREANYCERQVFRLYDSAFEKIAKK